MPYRGFTTNFLLPEPGRWSAAVCIHRFDGHAPDKSQIIPASMAKLANAGVLTRLVRVLARKINCPLQKI